MNQNYKPENLNVLASDAPEQHAKISTLLREYNQKLIDIGYGMKRSTLKQKNLIDTRPLCSDLDAVPSHNVPPSMMGRNGNIKTIVKSTGFHDYFTKDAQFFAYVPCFEEGVIQTNKDRYIYFKIKELDATSSKKSMVIYLQDFFMQGNTVNIWQAGISGDLCLEESETGDIENMFLPKKDQSAKIPIKISTKNVMLFPDIYRLIRQKTLGWSDMDMALWENVMIPTTERKLHEIVYTTKSDSFEHLCTMFMYNMPVINYELYCYKPKAIRSKSTGHTKGIAVPDAKPKRITRMIGPISMKSPKPPKLATEESIRRYKVASWHCRGGMRKLKSGKVVPFKPSIHHRKCLKDNPSDPMTQKLSFKSE